MPIRNVRLLCLLVFCLAAACHESGKTMSFYYWQPVFSLDSTETSILRDNAVQTLYVHYFNVDWPSTDSTMTIGPQLRYRSSPSGYTIIPVISLSNRFFEKLTPGTISLYASLIFSEVRDINAQCRIHNREIQFDCDWTEKTKDNYFAFLQEYHRISVQTISSVIRLYQLKYPEHTGIPPVDHGVLFYFHMTDTAGQRSVYERALVHRYTPSLRSYPMNLDVALPIFSSDKSDKDGENLFEIVTDINHHSNHRIRSLIFFDFDSQSVRQYNPTVFREVLDHTN